MKHTTAIVGMGELGAALFHILSKRRDRGIESWDIDPLRMPVKKSLAAVVSYADTIFLTVPSSSLRLATMSIAPYCAKNAVVISCAKGIEHRSNKTADQILAELLRRGQSYAIMGGPMLAEELQNDKGGYAVIATKKERAFMCVQDVVGKTALILEWSRDVHGVALCGVLKNIYAIGLGVVDGLCLGDNIRGVILAHALREMMIVLECLGGKKETSLGCAGAGDLVATGSSRYSSNYTVGMQYGRGEKSERHCEGRASIDAFTALLKKQSKNVPLLFTIDTILRRNMDPRKAMERFLRA